MSAEALRGIRSPGARGQDQNLVKKKQHNLINAFMYTVFSQQYRIIFCCFYFYGKEKACRFFYNQKKIIVNCIVTSNDVNSFNR